MSDIQSIAGLYVIPGFIGEDDERDLLACVNRREWDNRLSRRTQHYGYVYKYRGSKTYYEDAPEILGIIRDYCEVVEDYCRGRDLNTPRGYFNQIIVNEYTPGQGIAAHVDDKTQFGDVIFGISMGSDCVMQFRKNNITKEIILPRRSLLILSGVARNEYTHAIPARKNDSGTPRGVRVSITGRHYVG